VFVVFRDDVDLSDVEEELEDIGGLGRGAGLDSDRLEWLLAFFNEKMLTIEFLLCGLSCECTIGKGDGGGVGNEFESTTVDNGELRLILARLPEDCPAVLSGIDGSEVEGDVSAVVFSPLALLMESTVEDDEDAASPSPVMNFELDCLETGAEDPFPLFPSFLSSFPYGDLSS